MTPRQTSLAILIGTVVLPNIARADLGDAAKSTAEIVGYSMPIAGGAVTTVVNGFHIAYDEGSPRGWRIAGYLFGGVDVAMGVLLLTTSHETTTDLALGVVPLVVGTTSILTALLAPTPDDIVGPSAELMPVLTPTFAGLVWSGIF